MADEKVRVVKIDTGGAVQSVSNLKSKISEYRKELNECTVGSEEAKKKAIELREAQAQLTAAMNGAIDATGKIDNSYNGLVSQMAKLKAAWRATTDEAERAKIGEQIGAINGQLKTMDASIGNFQRNVGNYQSALEGLGGKGMQSITNGMNGIKKGMDVLKAHPFLAMLSVIVAVIMKIASAIKNSEDRMQSFQKALAPINALMNVFNTAIGKAADILVNVLTKSIDVATRAFSGFLKMIDKVAGTNLSGIISEATEAQREVTNLENELARYSRNIKKENAEIGVTISKLQNNFAKSEGNVSKQAEIAKKIAEQQKKINENNLALATKEYELIRKKNQLSDSNTQDLDAENEAYVKMINAQATLNNLTAEQRKSIKASAKEAKTSENEVDKLVKKLEEWNTKRTGLENEAETEKALTARYQRELALLKDNEEAKKLLKIKYEDDLKNLREKNAKQEIADLSTLYSTTNKENQNEYIQQQTALYEEYARTDNALKYQLDLKALEIEQTKKNLAANELYLASLEAEREAMIANGLDTIDIDNKITDAKVQNSQLRMAAVKSETEQQLELQQITYDTFTQAFDMLGSYTQEIASMGDGVSSKWADVFGKMSDTMGTLQESIKKVSSETASASEKMQSYGKMATAACSIASSVFSALADQQEADSKEGFEQQKKYQIAAATMSMLGGIVDAWTSAMNPANAWMSVWGQIAMGTAMSAMILGMGLAQIDSIKNQQFDGSSSATNTAASASVNQAAVNGVSAPTVTTQDVGNAAIEERITSQRVYVVESDIRKTGNRVSVVENESKY